MKKLKTTDTGGHPVNYVDFEFLQEQIRELAQACFSINDNAKVTILNGCEASTDEAGTISIDAGWVYYDSEFFQVDAHEAYPDSETDVAKWFVVETNDSRGQKTFKDGTIKQTYQIRKLEVVYVPSSVEAPLFSETQLLKSTSTNWQTLTLATGFGAPTNTNDFPLSICKKFGIVHIFGIVSDSTLTDEMRKVCDLPEGFRPEKYLGFKNHIYGQLLFKCQDALYEQYNCFISEDNGLYLLNETNFYHRNLFFNLQFIGE